MTVAEKMSYVLNKVLQTDGYLVRIMSRTHWEVWFSGEVVLQTISTSDINSHWRSIVQDQIAHIINDRIKSALNEV